MPGVFPDNSTRNLVIENPNAFGKRHESVAEVPNRPRKRFRYATHRGTSYFNPESDRGAPSHQRTSTTETPEGLVKCSLQPCTASSNRLCSQRRCRLGGRWRCRVSPLAGRALSGLVGGSS